MPLSRSVRGQSHAGTPRPQRAGPATPAGARTAGRRHPAPPARRRAPRLALPALALALGAVLLWSAPAGAQTATTLVSNTGQTVDDAFSFTAAVPKRAQQFTTGADPYTLSSIGIHFNTIDNTATAGSELDVWLSANSSGDPGAVLCYMSNPATFTSGAVNTFDAPGTCPTLLANTAYFVVAEHFLDADDIDMSFTASGDEDADSASGSSISNDRLYYDSDTTSWNTETVESYMIEVKGQTSDPVAISNVTQHRGFDTLVDATNTKISQAFTTGADAYTLSSIRLDFSEIANTATAGAHLTVTLNANSSGDAGAVLCTLTDPATFNGSDLNTFDAPATCPALAAGVTYFVVIERVTVVDADYIELRTTASGDEDAGGAAGWSINDKGRSYSSTTSTWADIGPLLIEVKGNPVVSALVSNTGQTAEASGTEIDDDYPKYAQAFTTGANGYTLGSIGVGFDTIANVSTAGGQLTATLNAVGLDGNPAASALCTLVDPATFTAAGVQTFDAPTTNPCPALTASTTYFVVVDRVNPVSTDPIIELSQTDSANEDAGGASDWLIADNYRYNTVAWSNVGVSTALMIEVKGDDTGTPSVTAVTVGFDASDYSVAEGGTVTVKVQLSTDPGRTVVIPITTTNQGGASVGDYSVVPANVTFNTGVTEKSFTITATQDTVDDDDESVKLGFGMLPASVTAGATSVATVSITDDDDPPVTGTPPTLKRVTGFALHSDNGDPYGVWGNADTIWVANAGSGALSKIFAYNRSDGSRDSGKDFNTLNAAGNQSVRGICSDGTTMFVADDGDDEVYAYKMSDTTRDSAKDITLGTDNSNPTGVWCDGDTVWVANLGLSSTNIKVFAYQRSDGTADSAKDIDTVHAAGNGIPRGLWSNGATMFVVEGDDDKVHAYKMSDESQDSDKEIDLDSDNEHAAGLWFDGRVLWVTDFTDDRLYVYDLPGAQPDNTPAVGNPAVRTLTSKNVLTATLTAGSNVGIVGFLSNQGSLSQTTFTLEGVTYTVKFLYDNDNDPNVGALWLTMDKEIPRAFTLSVAGQSFLSSRLDRDEQGSTGYIYSWHDAGLSWSDNDMIAVVLTVDSEVEADVYVIAGTSGITDATDGVVGAAYHYQWIRVDGTTETELDGETNLAYTPTVADWNKHLKVRVVFDDDAGYREYPRTSRAVGPVVVDSPTEGVLTITGDALVDGVLTANTSSIADDDGLGPFSYQWIRVDGSVEANVGTDSPTYTVTRADELKQIRVEVSFTDGRGNPGSVTSGPVGPVPVKQFVATGRPTIGGSPRVGSVLTVDLTSIRDLNGMTDARVNDRFSYLWVRHENGTPHPISGDTSSTYTVKPADAGATLTVTVVFTDDRGATERAESERFGPIISTNTQATWNASISGTLRVSEQLTLATGTIVDPDGPVRSGTVNIRWYRVYGLGEQLIPGATSATYTAANADVGAPLRVEYSFLDAKGHHETLSVITVGPIAGTFGATGVTITGRIEVGGVLTADVSDLDDPQGTSTAVNSNNLSYQWFRSLSADGGTRAIFYQMIGATSPTYTLTGTEEGQRIRVIVRFDDNAGNAETVRVTTAGTVGPTNNAPASGAPVISGTAEVGNTLTAVVAGRVSDSDGTDGADYRYQWIRVGEDVSVPDSFTRTFFITNTERRPRVPGETDIDGATDSTYVLAGADVGEKIRVRVSFTDDAGYRETLTSEVFPDEDPPTVVEQGNTVATGAPTISGTLEVGEELTADVSTIADEDGIANANYRYQWVRVESLYTYTRIPGETSSTYRLRGVDKDSQIRVRVRFYDDEDHSESVLSAAYGPIAGVNRPAYGVPIIRGTPHVFETLGADTSLITDADGLAGATFAYQWVRVAADHGSSSPATEYDTAADTYLVKTSDVGHRFQVNVRILDDAGYVQTRTSLTTGIVGGGPGNATGRPIISGTERVYQTLSANVSQIDDPDGLSNPDFSFQWARAERSGSRLVADDETLIPGAVLGTHILTPEDAGKLIFVRVGFTDDKGHRAWLNSRYTDPIEAAARPAGNTDATGVPTVHGPERVGELLAVGTSAIADDDGLDESRFRYQWIRVDADGTNPVDITNEDGVFYLLTTADAGKRIKVEVSFVDGAGHLEEATSEATGTIAAVPPRVSGVPVIDGILMVGETLTRDLLPLDGPDFAIEGDAVPDETHDITYTWIRVDGGVDADIANTDSVTYFLTDDDAGKKIKLRVNYTDDANVNRTVTSDATDTISAGPATGRPVISSFLPGIFREGSALGSSRDDLDDPDGWTINLSTSFQWIRVGRTQETDIPGALNLGYTPTRADVGHRLKVRWSFTDDIGNPESATSLATAVIATRIEPNMAATGLARIVGSQGLLQDGAGVRIGELLAADIIGIGDGNGIGDAQGSTNEGFSYQWVRVDGSIRADIAGADGRTYTPTSADRGHDIMVRVAFIDDDGWAETRPSTAHPVSAAGNIDPIGLPTISGGSAPPQVRETLTAETSGIRDGNGLVGVVFSYQWFRGNTMILGVGATSYRYELKPADQDTQIKVRVRYTDNGGNTETLFSVATATVVAPPSGPATGVPIINGDPRYLSILTVDLDDPDDPVYDPDGTSNATYLYQWIRVDDAAGTNPVDIAGATSDEFIVTDATLVGKWLRVKVSFTDDIGDPESVTSEAIGPITGAQAAIGKPTIRDADDTDLTLPTAEAPEVDDVLTAETMGITDPNGIDQARNLTNNNPGFSYQWIRHPDIDITGANLITYTLTATDAGEKIRVRVGFTDNADNPESVISDPTGTVVDPTPLPPPDDTGGTVVGGPPVGGPPVGGPPVGGDDGGDDGDDGSDTSGSQLRDYFVDDDGSVHEADINLIAAAGITVGCNPPVGSVGDWYCPGESVTRAQMASFLARALDLPDTDTDYFVDDDGSVHEADINLIAAAGITVGCNPPVGSDGDWYCPGESVTRAQMASFLARALDLPDTDTDYFVDDDGSVHEADINLIAAAGITVGCNPPVGSVGDWYCPGESVTRAQMASFLARALNLP